MIRIAVVEDEAAYQKQLTGYIADYQREKGVECSVTVFSDGLDLAENYRSSYDILFLDIQMEHLNGMETAQRIRQLDKDVMIIFITNLAQYALQGYQVEALSYLLKPISYFAFAQELQKAVRKIQARPQSYLRILQEGAMLRLAVSEISFVESQDHNVVYHTAGGRYTNRDTLKNVEKRLEKQHFCRCNNSYLVNLAHVERIDQNQVIVSGQPLRISRTRKKAFLEELATFVGRG